MPADQPRRPADEQALWDDAAWCVLPTRAFGDKSLTPHAQTVMRLIRERDGLAWERDALHQQLAEMREQAGDGAEGDGA